MMKREIFTGRIQKRMPLTLAWFLFACSLTALPYALNWYTTDGGGGTSSSGAYVLSGTIGQPDAAIVSGGSYQLVGGFWFSPMGPSTNEIPELVIQCVNGNLWISWSSTIPGFRLEQTEDPLLSDWTNAPSGNPVVIPLTETSLFYRLCKP